LGLSDEIYEKGTFSLVLVYHLFRALEITYEKGTPTKSIVNLFSDSLKLKISSSDLVPSHSLNWYRRTFNGMSLPLFPAYGLWRKKVCLGRFVSPGEFSSVIFLLFWAKETNSRKRE
jgi:hypothetical protein